MRKIFYVFMAWAALFAACAKNAEIVDIYELGCEYPEVEMPSCAGAHTFNMISSASVTATIPSDVDWLSFEGTSSKEISFYGDAPLTVVATENLGDVRTASINVVCGSRNIQLVVIQEEGEGKTFYFPQRNVLIEFTTGTTAVDFVTDIPASELSYSVTYEQGKDWIEEPLGGIIDGKLVFAAFENTTDERRGAIITVSAKDGAGRDISARLYVSQKTNGESVTIPVTVQDVRALTLDDLDGEGRIRKNYVLKARVLNDNSEGNGAQNRNVSIISQDKSLSSRTVYLQSLTPDASGQYSGIQLQFKTEDDNSTERYDILEINLKGLKYKAEGSESGKNPFHVILSDAGVVNVISSTIGSKADLPVIRKKISELKDEDIYTYVTLENCEFPVRKGPFCPVDMRYSNIANKYPMVMRDAQGSIIYMVSNVDCAWARDGKGIPQGSGAVSGIVVNEACDNFEWDSQAEQSSVLLPDYFTDRGYIGRYQIRPVTKEEIAVSDNLEDCATTLISEWRYMNASFPEQNIVNSVNDVIYPSYPPVADPLTDPAVNGTLSLSTGKITLSYDWTHLGPLSGNRITDIPGGNGVYDADGRSIHWSPLSYLSTCGIISANNGSSWLGGTWYSGDHANPKLEEYFWEIQISTRGLSASKAPMSLTIGTSNATGDDTGAPRYWMMAWSTDNALWHTVTASDYVGERWVDLTAKGGDYTYTIPDFPMIANQKQYNLPGNKYISINFPSSADVWDKEKLYIHLYPAKDVSGDNASGISYDSAKIRASRRSCLNYVGIRCKK